MNNLLTSIKNFSKKIVLFDWERRVLIRMIKQCLGGRHENTRLLDVGCGYGRVLEITKNLCASCVGVDVNPEIVRSNKEKEFECYLPEDLPRDGLKFDIILMFHVIEHFNPRDLLEFIDSYLDLLHPGGYLIIATPLLSNYFFDDFDHIKPYQPEGFVAVFGRNNSQVQYHSRHVMNLIDLWYRRSYFRITHHRARYIKTKFSRVLIILDIFSATLSFICFGRLGRVDGWMGIFQKVTK